MICFASVWGKDGGVWGRQASMLGGFHSVDFIFILALAERNFSPRRMPCFNFPQRAFSVRARTACQLWTELAVKTQRGPTPY